MAANAREGEALAKADIVTHGLHRRPQLACEPGVESAEGVDGRSKPDL
jgi:hypothetical protein